MNAHIPIIVDEGAPGYFAKLVKSKSLTKDQAEEQLREVLTEITSENASEFDIETAVEKFYELLK